MEMRDCPDCAVKPGQKHLINCDVERCSVCGGQRLQCNCKGHDRAFARWNGFWPGLLEANALGIGLNDMIDRDLEHVFFVKPNTGREAR